MSDNKPIDLAEIRREKRETLVAMLDEKRSKRRQIRFAQALGQVTKTHEIGMLKKDIARIQTVLNDPSAQKVDNS